MKKKLVSNYTRMLPAILNKSWRQQPAKQQLYSHQSPITNAIQIRRTRHVRYCRRSKDELIRDVFLWTPSYGQVGIGQPARTSCADTECSLEELPGAMDDRDERVSERSVLAARQDYIYIYIYIYCLVNLKLVDKFSYLGSSVSSTEKDIDTRLTKAWTAIDRLSIIWKSDLTDKMKCSFFQAAVVSILLYGCTTWTLTKRLEKKLDGNYTRMLRAILNKSWRQHPTRHQLYGHQPPITKTVLARRTRHAGHCWRSKDELISDVLLWTPAYGQAKAGQPARTHIQQLCEDRGCSPEDLPETMNDREKC